jgi:PAS domain S-box-containing protein
MKENEASKDKAAGQRMESLQRENEALSQQVKMLIKAEGKLYEYQQELDEKLNEYKELYEFNRKLNSTLNLDEIFGETVSYLTQKLEYERAVIFRRLEEDGSYHVCVLDGYYDPAEKAAVQDLVLGPDTVCLRGVLNGQGYQVFTQETAIAECCRSLVMSEYFVYRVGHQVPPPAILMVGNCAKNVTFYRRVTESAESMASIGNVVGLLSAVAENRIFYERMEQARAQERRAEAKYRSIFENAIEGIFQRTLEGKYMAVNQSLARMLGYSSPEEVIEAVDSIRDQLYVAPREHDELIALLQEKGGAVEAFETQMYRKDGTPMWISISMRIVHDCQGRVAYYEGTTEEITERKKGEEALRESERRYRQLSEDLEERVKETVDELRQKDRILILQGRQAVMGEMISNIAHQWRQPLNMLALLVQDLQITSKRQGITSEFVEDNVGKSLEIIRQMSKTIDYFRYFFMPEKEKVEFRVAETLEKTLAILNGSFRIHGIATEIVKSSDPTALGYPTEFIQVLLNILINARDALTGRKPPEPKITIKLYTEGERTVVTVTDNAGGIPDEIIDRIFDPYFTTKGPEQGTGIGLFMCKTIVEKNMGGSLTVRNVEGGAEFRIEV